MFARNRTTSTLIAVIIGVATNTAAAQDSWVGQTVFRTKDSKHIKFGDVVGGKQIYYQLSDDTEFKVREEKEGRLRIRDVHHEGWVDKADFVPARDAMAYFHHRIQANPKDFYARFMRGTIWLNEGENDNAIKDFDECIRLHPTFAFGFNSRGNAWSAKREYERAIRDYDEAIHLEPTEPSFFRNRGLTWHDAKEYDKAIRDYDEAIRLDPKDPRLFGSRADTWRVKKEYDKAIHDYSEAIRLNPNSASSFSMRGLVWHEKKDYDRAIRDYDESIRLDPKNASRYYLRARAWGDKKEYDKAIRDYDKVIRLDPKYAGAYNSRAWIWATCPDAKYRDGMKAVESAKHAMELGKSAGAMDTLAAAYAEAGDFEEAVRWVAQAIEIDNAEQYRRRLDLYRNGMPYRQE